VGSSYRSALRTVRFHKFTMGMLHERIHTQQPTGRVLSTKQDNPKNSGAVTCHCTCTPLQERLQQLWLIM
jgi:hypothetical protein